MRKTSTVNTAGITGTRSTNVMRIAQIGMLAAIAVILMLFQIPLPFAPAFYQIDLSEVPVLIGSFAMGPIAGMMIELVKILLNLLINGTKTAGVGEVANFLIGCALCMPAGIIYRMNKTKKNAVIGLVVGTIFMTVVGSLLNAYVLLPAYALAFQMPIDGLVAMGSAINGNITDLMTFVLYAVAPFNLLKGVVVSVIVLVSYKKIRMGTGML